MGEADSNQFMQLKNQPVIAAEKFAREENLSTVLTPTLSKYKDEQLRLSPKEVDVVDRANRKTCVTLLQYSVDMRESCYAQVRLFTRKKEDEKFQQIVYVNYKLEEIINLFDVMNSIYDNVIAIKPIFIVL